MQNKFDCPVCWDPFNDSNRLPRVLPSCGHTICAYCLKKILDGSDPKCPLDKTKIKANDSNSVPVNLLARDLLEGKLEWAQCKTHNRKLEYFCEDEQKSICSRCLFFGECRSHKLKLITDFKPQIDEKKKEIEGISDTFKGHFSELLQLVQEKQREYSQMFEEILKKKDVSDLDVMLFELTLELEAFFTKEVEVIQATFGKGSSFANSLSDKILELKNFTQTEHIIALLNQDIFPLNQKLSSLVSNFLQSLEKKLLFISSAIDQILKNVELSSPDNLSQTLSKWFETEKKELSGLDAHSFSPLRFSNQFRIQIKNQTISLRKKTKIKDYVLDLKQLEDISVISYNIEDFEMSEKTFLILRLLQKKLKKVNSIYFESSGTKEANLENIFPSFFCNPSAIQHLTIQFFGSKFSRCPYLFTQVLPQMQNLTSLTLEFDLTQIECETINLFTENFLKKHKTLEKLHLRILKTQVKEDAVLNLINNIPPNVKSLLLGFGQLPISDREGYALARTLAELNSLEFFELGIFETKITDASVQGLFDSIPETVKNLRLGLHKIPLENKTLQHFLENKVHTLKLLENLEVAADDRSLEREVEKYNQSLKARIASQISDKSSLDKY